MRAKISRRDFIKKSTGAGFSIALGGTALTGSIHSPQYITSPEIDVAVVKGTDYLKSTKKAVELIGKIDKFIPKNSKVALLANVQSTFPGTFTKPEIFRAAAQLCREAGAKEINCVSLLPVKNWEETGLAEVVRGEGINLKLIDTNDKTQFRSVPVPEGKGIKEAEIMNALYENDVFITLPITKDHAGNKFTGTLKNMMGLNARPHNRANFHKGQDKEAIAHLDQCIADLNTIVKPALCIVDATELITTNGPMGPGAILRPLKVVAGVDRIAIDSYCTTLWGMKPTDIIMIQRGYEHKLGEMDLNKVTIQEVSV